MFIAFFAGTKPLFRYYSRLSPTSSAIASTSALIDPQTHLMPKKSELIRKARKAKTIPQVAAIPCRLNDLGMPEIMLVTSRTTQRFIIPKGWPMKGKSARKAAALEAREEAGVVGKALREPIGHYAYWKRLADCFVPVRVTVYLVAVDAVASEWKEEGARQRAWVSAEEAAILIDEPQLAALIDSVGIAARLEEANQSASVSRALSVRRPSASPFPSPAPN